MILAVILAERYQIIRPLAQGGFGKTFLACDHHLPGQPHCVIKRLHLPTATPTVLATAQRLFNLEAETLYRLGNHPQIPTLLAHFRQTGKQTEQETEKSDFYLVQQYIEGVLLQTTFDQIEPASPPGSAKIPVLPERVNSTHRLLQELLSVLSFVHEQNIIHRDVKPANIIRRTSDELLFLIDFGAVKASIAGLQTLQQPLTVSIGSPGYIAPEQQAGRPCFASDLYAVGMIGFQSLTGVSPQQWPRDSSTGELIYSAEALEANENARSVLSFLHQLTQPSPPDRFPNATLALQSLKALNHPIRPTVQTPPLQPAITQAPATQASNTNNSKAPEILEPTLPPAAVRPAAPPLSATDYRNRQALKNKVHRFWIQGVLGHSLHGQVLLTLGLEERTSALALPWNISWQTEEQSVRPLDAGARVLDVFQQLGEGRSLLILGEPGAGKTTTLLTLTRDLLQQSSARIPAIFNLSSWTGGPLERWLVTELNSKYQIPIAIGTAWVNEQQLLLLLDGLDEVRADLQASCAAAINRFHQDYGPEIVVCCRIKDYEAMRQPLGFQSAVFVRSLTDAQIWQYLNQSNAGLTGLRSLLEQSAQPDRDRNSLLSLARSPLILNIMALTYQGLSAADIPQFTQGENYTHQLFSAYVERMFKRRELCASAPYSKRQTLKWLHTLAVQLTQSSQTVFLIERMQPSWLTAKSDRFTFAALVWATFLITATLVGTHVISIEKIPLGLIICGALFVHIFGVYRIVPAETLRWSWQKASRALLVGLTVGPLIGWALKVGFTHIFADAQCIWQPLCFQQISLLGLAFGTVLGVTYGVIRGLSGDRITTAFKPNQGIRQSAKNALLSATVAAITPLLIAQLLGNTSPAFWATAGLFFGLALGGGEACIKHGILRLILFTQGRIPWNYARFLDYAADRIFLQKVGGGYIFIHRLLLEHFATLRIKDFSHTK